MRIETKLLVRERPHTTELSLSHTQKTHSLQGHTCREKALSAGMGMRAAMKNAVTLLMEVRATLAPVLFRHSPVRSWQRQTERRMKGKQWNTTLNQIIAKGKSVILEIMYNYCNTDLSDSDCNVFWSPEVLRQSTWVLLPPKANTF